MNPWYAPQNYDIVFLINQIKGINMINLIGSVFSKWTIISLAGRDKKSNQLFNCRCVCGIEKIQSLYTLKLNRSTQCKSCHMNSLNKVDEVIGKQFGKLIVINNVPNKNGNKRYLCMCECNREMHVDGYRLRNNQSKSCPNCRVKTHGMSYTSIFRIWSDMLSRCNNSNHKNYHNYGGRGIKVSENWLKFENFYKDMGDRPKGLQIDRINNDGNYEHGNCRWATASQNVNNRRCSKRKIT